MKTRHTIFLCYFYRTLNNNLDNFFDDENSSKYFDVIFQVQLIGDKNIVREILKGRCKEDVSEENVLEAFVHDDDL